MSDVAIEAIAGATGAVVAAFATYPVLTLSTFQAVRKKRYESDQPAMPPLYSFLDTIYQLTAVDGWRRLYDGLKPALMGSALSQGVYFYFYSTLKRFISHADQGMGILGSMTVAYLAGCINVLITNPIWVITTRMQIHRNGGTAVWKAIQAAYQQDGYRWAFKGIVPSLILVSNPAIQFTIYEMFARGQRQKSKKLNSSQVFWMSAISKLGATVATYPLVLVKSRLQAYESRSRQSYDHMMDAIETILQEEGLLGFYNGLPAKCFQSMCSAVILMVVKEKVVQLLTSMKPRSR